MHGTFFWRKPNTLLSRTVSGWLVLICLVPYAPQGSAVQTAPVTVSQTGALVTITNGIVDVKYDTGTGLIGYWWDGQEVIRDSYASADVDGLTARQLSIDYSFRSYTSSDVRDSIGVGKMLSLIAYQSDKPALTTNITIYAGRRFVLIQGAVTADHAIGTPLIQPIVLDQTVVSSAWLRLSEQPSNLKIMKLGIHQADWTGFVDTRDGSASVTSPWASAIVDASANKGLVGGVLTSEDWKSAAGVTFVAPATIRAFSLYSGADLFGKASSTTGTEIASEKFFLGVYAPAKDGFEEYSRVQAILEPITGWQEGAIIGWGSWAAWQTSIDETKIKAQTDWIAAHTALGYRYVQIDDGWQIAAGDWQPNAKFPSGMKSLVDYIHSKGLQAGIWIAPVTAVESAVVFKEHPDWFLRTDGRFVQYYGAEYVLDVTNPSVKTWLQDLFITIRDTWGFDYVKADYIIAALFEGDHYDGSTGMQAYNAYLRLSFDTLTGDPNHPVYVLKGTSPWLPARHSHARRMGMDIQDHDLEGWAPSWHTVAGAAREIATEWFTNTPSHFGDPDQIAVRATALTLEEARTLATVVALGGPVWLVGDDMGSLPAERLELVTNPEVLQVVESAGWMRPPRFVYGSPSAEVWDAPQADGSHVVGMFNWSDAPKTVSVDWVDLDLSANSHLVRDVWQRADVGSFATGMGFSIPPHASRLVRVTSPNTIFFPIIIAR